MEDAHIADPKFNNDDNIALFGVFDGHGGREVALYCGDYYKGILNGLDANKYDTDGNKDTKI
jgi:protein phosphatase 1G